METDDKRVRQLAEDIHCGVPLAHDLLKLAGDDAQMVRDASAKCHGVDAMKAYIIDRRFKKNKLA